MSMPILERAVNSVIRLLIHTLCRVDGDELDRIPRFGPAILVTNHSTSLEGPIYYVLLDPRKKTALGKSELWGNPFTRFFMQLWGVDPSQQRRSRQTSPSTRKRGVGSRRVSRDRAGRDPKPLRETPARATGRRVVGDHGACTDCSDGPVGGAKTSLRT